MLLVFLSSYIYEQCTSGQFWDTNAFLETSDSFSVAPCLHTYFQSTTVQYHTEVQAMNICINREQSCFR